MHSRLRASALVMVAAAAVAATLAGAGGATIQTDPPTNNTPPTLSGTTQQGSVLSATSGSWASTAVVSYTYQFESCDSGGINCSNIGSASTSTTYTLQASDVGKRVRVNVTATNTGGSNSAESNATAVITAATPPSNTVLPVISGTTQVGQVVKTTDGTWTGTAPITFPYQWKRCDVNGANCTSISNTNSHKYTIVSADVGHKLRVDVVGTNAAGTATVTSGSSTKVTIGPPANTVAPTINGTASVGSNLNVSNGTWTGVTPITYTYQWQRCDANGNNCASISGATRNSYSVATTDTGSTLRAQVTATNSGGGQTASTNAVGPVASTVPANTAAPVLSGTLTTGQSLTVTTGTWTGQTPLNYTYAWERCDATAAVCTAITGANRNSYQLETADEGAYLRAKVTATNRNGNATATSNLVGPVQLALPTGATTLPNGKTSVPFQSVPTGDVFKISAVKLTPTTIKHRKQVKLTVTIGDSHGYVISGAHASVTSTRSTWIARVTTHPSNLNGQITVTIRPTLKAPLKGTLTLRIRPSTPHGGTSIIRILKIKMRS